MALKELYSEYRTEEFLERFKLEVRTAVRLTAPNIVRVYSFNPTRPYYVMEYCGDGDLNRLIKSRRPIPLTRTVSLIRQICEALVVAHEAEMPILHRDLKPGNVLFQGEVPKVADFGLAKMLGGSKSGLTVTRGMMGTVAYASPEQQTDPAAVDHRTDLWSIGVMLYELLTFRSPFEKPGDDYVNVAIRVRTEPPANPPYAVPEPIWNVVLRALEKDPARRFASAREMIQTLDAALASIPEAGRLLLPPEDTLDDVDRMAAQVAEHFKSESFDSAQALIRRMKEIAPDHGLSRYWERSVRDSSVPSPRILRSAAEGRDRLLDSRINSIRTKIAEWNYVEARRECGRVLIDHPHDTAVHGLLMKINEEEKLLGQAMDRAHQQAEKQRANGALAAVAEIWRQMDADFTNHPDIKAELAVVEHELELEARRAFRERTENDAKRLQAEDDLSGAIDKWRQYLDEHPDDVEAVEIRREIHGRLVIKTQRERLEKLRAEASSHRGEERLDDALAIWKEILNEVPTDEEAHREAESIRIELADRKRARDLAEARSKAAKRADAGDLSGAISTWRAFLRDYANDEEAMRQIQDLTEDLAERKRAVRRAELEQLLRTLENRLDSGRYGSLEKTEASILQALESARASLVAGEARSMASARDRIAETKNAAETAVTEAVREQRLEIRDRLEEALEQLPEDSAPSTEAESALCRAVDDALAALAHLFPPDSAGDPLQPLAEARRSLQRGLDSLAREREETTERSRKRALAMLDVAERSIAALREFPAGSVAYSQAVHLANELAELAKRSQSTAKLEEVPRSARAIKEEADSTRASAEWMLAAELSVVLDESLDLIGPGSGDHLCQLAIAAAGALEDEGTLSPVEMSNLIAELREEIDSCRSRLDAERARATDSWQQAAQACERIDVRELSPVLAEELKAVRQDGDAALAAKRFAEVERCADCLRAIAERCRLAVAWEGDCRAVLAIEGSTDNDGVVIEPLGTEQRELLARYRETIAKGSPDELRVFKEQLARSSARDEENDREADSGDFQVPTLGRRARRLNERYHSSAIRRFDSEVAEYERARSGRNRVEASRLSSALVRSHEALLRPPSIWRRAMLPVAGVLVLVIAVGVQFMRPDLSHVTLISVAGEVRIVEVTRNGLELTDFPADSRAVTEAGVLWELEPGEYRVTTERGAEVIFRAPCQDAVLVPAEKSDHSPQLMQLLGLDELLRADVP